MRQVEPGRDTVLADIKSANLRASMDLRREGLESKVLNLSKLRERSAMVPRSTVTPLRRISMKTTE